MPKRDSMFSIPNARLSRSRRLTMEKQRIEVQKSFSLNEEERLQIARLLIKAGYTVKISKIKQDNKSVICIDYWR